jgi:hypothetical protein
MNAPKNAANDPVAPEVAQQKPRAADDRSTPATDMQPEDAGTADSGAANRGSPAAPVMKQFAKTKAESTGRP